MPIHVHRRRKDVGHWVLGVLTFKDMCIYIYDSNRGALNDDLVMQALLSHAFMIPYFLINTGFYGKRNDIDWNSDAYIDKALSDTFDVNLVSGLPHQSDTNCGAFVTSFAEHFIMGKRIEKKTFDIDTYRLRIGALLWQHGRKKQMLNAVSDNEVT
ncbi:hypothetical protein HAX54_049123 [Datura stramonium]|uniref:Ubiquitin-like protease family profile domain-containing protein n=1 Tax=Datura stramonium TaxID=4076 RepID=A0ABS8SV61_DATST|nr:hypothetical protein [Datura stramonium]